MTCAGKLPSQPLVVVWHTTGLLAWDRPQAALPGSMLKAIGLGRSIPVALLPLSPLQWREPHRFFTGFPACFGLCPSMRRCRWRAFQGWGGLSREGCIKMRYCFVWKQTQGELSLATVGSKSTDRSNNKTQQKIIKRKAPRCTYCCKGGACEHAEKKDRDEIGCPNKAFYRLFDRER